MNRAEPCRRMQGALQDALPIFFRSLCKTGLTALGGDDNDDDDLDWTNDPEKVEYIQQLLDLVYESRAIIRCYNVVLVLIVLALAVWHWAETRSDERKWRRLMRQPPGGDTSDGTASPPAGLLSSIAIAGTATPPPDAKGNIDIERIPLLTRNGQNRTTAKPRMAARISRAVRCWLTRQPAPLPVINRTLPSNGTSLFILAWLAINVFLHLYHLPTRSDFFFIFADRTGCVFAVNLPLLYLLSAKNQPLRRLTGYSYEALNIFHRRVGELLCFEAALHFVSMLLWQFLLAREWLIASRSAYVYFTHPIILCGIGALVCYELLFFTSLASFRQRWYELFLASHVLLQALGLVLLWFHYPTARPYAAAALLIFLADRLVWRLGLKSARVQADLRPLDGDTLVLEARWDIPPPSPPRRSCRWWRSPSFLTRQTVLHGWHPTDHVFLTIPALSPLQAHPFTIASAAPGRPHEEPRRGTNTREELERGGGGEGEGSPEGGQTPTAYPIPTTTTTAAAAAVAAAVTPRPARLTLLIRAYAGFTRDLLHLSRQAGRVSARVDGPYGSPHALGMLRASGSAVLVAGGSGIAVALPLVRALLRPGSGSGEGGRDDVDEDKEDREDRTVRLLWVTHAREHREWVPRRGELDECVRRGLDLVIPEPTAEAGRPDVAGMVRGWIDAAAAEGREVGVVVSGPDGLNRAVRNACADAIGRGKKVRVAVEKFGW
ncbi:hypothetical protein L209DRAFT_758352 [Thermothelomyces heterothallicus CBS 203.75]